MGVSVAGITLITAGGLLTGKGPAGRLKPRPGPPPKTPLMPDQTSVNQAQQLEEAQAAALRQGRASTILTTPSNTGDRLGP